jgi:hypothetical protein
MRMNEEFVVPTTEELRTTEAWSNVQASILKVGRTSHAAPADLDDDAKAAYLESKEADGDVPVERFRGINEHIPMPGMSEEKGTAWISKVVGD